MPQQPGLDDEALARALEDVVVRRSRRRVRTVTAFREGGRTVVAIPARFTRTQEREWVLRMVTKLVSQENRRRPSDEKLAARAAILSERYLDGRARPTSVAWSTNQGRRWGSCTPSEGTIRISTRVRGLPAWVLDYVLLHELAHLLHGGHGPEFWALLDAYPRTERARGFLDGIAFAGDAPADELEPDDTEHLDNAEHDDDEPDHAAAGDADTGRADTGHADTGHADAGHADAGHAEPGHADTGPDDGHAQGVLDLRQDDGR